MHHVTYEVTEEVVEVVRTTSRLSGSPCGKLIYLIIVVLHDRIFVPVF